MVASGFVGSGLVGFRVWEAMPKQVVAVLKPPLRDVYKKHPAACSAVQNKSPVGFSCCLRKPHIDSPKSEKIP